MTIRLSNHARIVLVTSLLQVTFKFDPSLALIPASPKEQTQRAIASIKNVIQQGNDADDKNKRPCRLFVDYLIPLPPETNAMDFDPWPGGLAQMYPYAEDIVKEILQGIVDEPAGPCTSQIVSSSDCCGLFIQESKVSAKNDVASLVFPGVDQLDTIQQVNDMVGPERTLLLFNKQFQRVADFGLLGGRQQKAQQVIFDTFQYGWAFQELACRGEDTKLIYDSFTGWSSFVICDENVDLGRQEFKLLPPQSDRPIYDDLEKKINEIIPEPLWMRKMGEVDDKGFKFQRGR